MSTATPQNEATQTTSPSADQQEAMKMQQAHIQFLLFHLFKALPQQYVSFLSTAVPS